MISRKQAARIAQDIIDERHLKALDVADKHKAQVYEKSPRLEEIDNELLSVGVNAARSVLRGSDAKKVLESLSKRSLDLQDEYERILNSLGYSKKYIEPDYVCKFCNDTGFIEKDGKKVRCGCFDVLVTEEVCKSYNKELPLDESRFDNFEFDYYLDTLDENGINPRVRMRQIYNYCTLYAHEFSSASKNLLFQGGTGLGKTHLSLAIANAVIQKGYSVIYMTASDIVSKLQREHFSYNYQNEEEIVNSLLECDLLIIDDLGTEFSSAYSVSAIYNLFNSRILKGKPMIISTNMSLSEIEQMYSQRFMSRIIGTCDRLLFAGNDVRAIKRSKS